MQVFIHHIFICIFIKLFVFGATLTTLFALSFCAETREIEESVVEHAAPQILNEMSSRPPQLLIDIEETYDCVLVEADCLNPVIIIGLPKQDASYNTMLSYITEGKTEEFFLDKNWKNVFPDLNEKAVANIIEGNIIVEKASYVKGGNMIIFKDKKGKVLLAVPFLHKS